MARQLPPENSFVWNCDQGELKLFYYCDGSCLYNDEKVLMCCLQRSTKIYEKVY